MSLDYHWSAVKKVLFCHITSLAYIFTLVYHFSRRVCWMTCWAALEAIATTTNTTTTWLRMPVSVALLVINYMDVFHATLVFGLGVGRSILPVSFHIGIKGRVIFGVDILGFLGIFFSNDICSQNRLVMCTCQWSFRLILRFFSHPLFVILFALLFRLSDLTLFFCSKFNCRC